MIETKLDVLIEIRDCLNQLETLIKILIKDEENKGNKSGDVALLPVYFEKIKRCKDGPQ